VAHRDVSISTINSTMKMTEDQLSSLRDNLICYCRRFSGGDAEDVVQTTLLKALPLLQGQQSHANVTAFMRRIAKNTWLDWLRHEKYCQPFESVSFAAEAGETSLEHTLYLADALRLVMVKLTPQQRKVFFLCDTVEAVQATTYALIHATTRKSLGGTRHTNGSDILMLAV
jgi:DNA-directed RNA polymerase specialized sigma24 family protein